MRPFSRWIFTQSLNFLFCLKACYSRFILITEKTVNWKLFTLKVQRRLKKQEPISYLKLEKTFFNSDNLYWRKGAHQRNGGKLNPYILIKQYEATKSTDICHSRLCLAKHVCLRSDESSFSFWGFWHRKDNQEIFLYLRRPVVKFNNTTIQYSMAITR